MKNEKRGKNIYSIDHSKKKLRLGNMCFSFFFFKNKYLKRRNFHFFKASKCVSYENLFVVVVLFIVYY